VTSSARQRLLFLGTPEFAVPSLRALAASSHEVVGVVSQPDRPRGRGRKRDATPIHAAALELGLPLIQPEKVGDREPIEWMRAQRPSLGIVVAFGQFIPKSVRELPTLGMINAHGSLLPRHRGAAPIQHAIFEGDETTGISVMRVVRDMDAGPECLRLETPIGPEETAGDLFERLSHLAADALCQAVDQISAGTAHFVEQDASQATFAPKLDRDFAKLHFERPRHLLLRRIRAATPWPGCSIRLQQADRVLKLVRVRDGGGFETAAPVPHGRVEAVEGRLRIAALDGWIDVLRVQASGRRPMSSEEYLRGAGIQPDEEALEP